MIVTCFVPLAEIDDGGAGRQRRDRHDAAQLLPHPDQEGRVGGLDASRPRT